jgi:hypothetical protein
MPDGMISPRPPDAAHMCEQNPDKYGFESVRVMRLQPGDIIALHVKDHLTQMARAILRDQLKRTFPDHETIIIDGDAQVTIVRPDADHGSTEPNLLTTKATDG